MKALIKWAIGNGPAMNTIMIAVLLVGGACAYMMRREVFPEFELEIVLVTVTYPGASPEEIESGICKKLEESVRSVDGIKKQTSVAREGSGFLILELEPSVKDVQKVLNEIRSEIDRLPNFPPELAEEPNVQQLTFRTSAIRVGLLGPAETEEEKTASDEERQRLRARREWALREHGERLRDKLIALPSVSQANISGAKSYQIDVEIPEHALRAHNLTLADIAQRVRRENVEIPGGNLRTDGTEMLLRGKNKRLTGAGISEIQVIPNLGGDALTVGDLGVVHDGFEDMTSIHEINGRPGLVISVDRTADEDLFKLTDAVIAMVEDEGSSLPPGYELKIWGDTSIDVRERVDMLVRNGLTGLVLVFVVLAIFLDIRLAFWVSLGIPVSILGACAVLLFAGQTLNMLSMFAFLMALGILVDDAIVIGENIYEHRQYGKKPLQAAIDGAYEVVPSVAASVTTTIVAFCPLLFVSGVMGKFIAVMPLAVIAMLIISLLESMFILPCHLAHTDSAVFTVIDWVFYPFRFVYWAVVWVNARATTLLEKFINNVYLPALRWSLTNPLAVFSGACAILILFVGVVFSGFTPFNIFPKMDSRIIEARLTFPDGTPAAVTDKWSREVEHVISEIDKEYRAEHDEPLVMVRYRKVGESGDTLGGPNDVSSGSHVGMVSVELVSPEERNLSSQQIIEMWRARSPDIPGIDPTLPGAGTIVFEAPKMGPGGKPIEFKIVAPSEHFDEMSAAVERCKAELRTYPGVFDVVDDDRPGKPELQLKLKDRAKSLGVTEADLYETVRATYHGDEAMRVQRGRHEVKIMVRYPEEDRRSLTGFKNIRVKTSGGEYPLTELAAVTHARGTAEVNRVDQLRSITISADINEAETNSSSVLAKFQSEFVPELQKDAPNISFRWEGQAEQTRESVRSLMAGFVVAMLVMFLLLTIEFRSYVQPLLILAIIPFGAIGAILGHTLMGLPVTLFSLFGLVALTGVVVNDSIVLIDFINHRVRDGIPLRAALIDAGRRRFRPVMLTSITTVAGLIPMLLERSFQAQILIPMATSMVFGLMMATILVLILVPVMYEIYARIAMQPGVNFDDSDELPQVVALGAAGDASQASANTSTHEQSENGSGTTVSPGELQPQVESSQHVEEIKVRRADTATTRETP